MAGLGADVGISGGKSIKLISAINWPFTNKHLGSKACVEPSAGVSLNADVAKADTPEDPIIEKQIAVRISLSIP